MRIAINGTGVAGPTLAWWLRRHGHEPVLFENAPKLRTGGYVIDFWGVGYDVAEKMGLVPNLYQNGYIMKSLQLVNRRGRQVAGADVDIFRSLVNNRYVSIARGDIASMIYRACDDIETRFSQSIVGIDQHTEGVRVQISDGSEQEFDLVVGTDGLHSQVRTLVFGPESRFERRLGYCVAGFSLPRYSPRDELVYVMHNAPSRSVGRMSLRDDHTLFIFIFRAELLKSEPGTSGEEKAVLLEVFGDMGWEVPRILERLDEVDDLYFDHVSQIRMDRWTNGRVALVGDACACVSLLAGEGTGLAMTEAYILAGELKQSGGDHVRAFRKYETMLQPLIRRKQDAALGLAGFFAPKTALGVFLRDLATKACSTPFVAKRLLGPSFRDDFALPEYGK